MALGCDMYFAAAVIALRRRYHDVTLEAAIPGASQADRWNAAQRALYDLMLAECDEVSILQHGYTPDCMQDGTNTWSIPPPCCSPASTGAPAAR